MKKIKFPLEMAGGRQVRELDEFQEAFDLEKAVEYFSNGKLQKWLENNYNDDILEELEELTGEEEDFIQRFTRTLGVDYEQTADIKKLIKRSELKEKLKRHLSEEELEEILPATADDQETLEGILAEGCSEIYLYAGTYLLPETAHDVILYGIQEPKLTIRSESGKEFRKRKVKLVDVLPADEETENILHSNVWNDAVLDLLDILESAIRKGEK